MRPYLLSAGSAVLAWGCDAPQLLLLPLPDGEALDLISGGDGPAFFSLQAAAPADAAKATVVPARAWKTIKGCVPLCREAVEPIAEDHPVLKVIVDRCLAAVGARPAHEYPASLWTDLARDVLVRSGRLPDAAVLAATGLKSDGETEEAARVFLARMRAEGFSPAGAIANDEIDTYEQEQTRIAKAAAKAAADKRAKEQINVYSGRWAHVRVYARRNAGDIADALLLAQPLEPGDYYFDACGLPIPREETLLARGRSIRLATSFTGTAEQFAQTHEPLPGGIAAMLLEICDEFVTRAEDIAPEDFDGDLREPERCFAGKNMREHLAILAKLLSVVPTGPTATLAHAAFFSLAVGYAPNVAIPDAIHWTKEALKAQAERSLGRSFVNDGYGRPQEVPRDPNAWPYGFPRPDAVEREIMKYCFPDSPADVPAVWNYGSCLRPMTPAELREVKLALDPSIADRVIAAVTKNRQTVRSAWVWRELAREGVIETATPTAEVRGWVTRALEGLGFKRSLVKDDTGARSRAFVRELSPGDTPVDDPPAPADVDDDASEAAE
jgi:hypothetical protein